MSDRTFQSFTGSRDGARARRRRQPRTSGASTAMLKLVAVMAGTIVAVAIGLAVVSALAPR